jgi:hypothetical protein
MRYSAEKRIFRTAFGYIGNSLKNPDECVNDPSAEMLHTADTA